MWAWAKKLNGYHGQFFLVEAVAHVIEGGRKQGLGGFSLYSFVMKISTMPHHLISPSFNDYKLTSLSLWVGSSLSILMTSLILLWGSLVSVIRLLAKVNVSKTDCYSTLIFFFMKNILNEKIAIRRIWKVLFCPILPSRSNWKTGGFMISSTRQKIIWDNIIVFNISKLEIVKKASQLESIQDWKVGENV